MLEINFEEKELDHLNRLMFRCKCAICEKCWIYDKYWYCIYGGPYSGYVMDEYLKGSAIKYEDERGVVSGSIGTKHDHLLAEHGWSGKYECGFITNTDRFVGREEAAKIAYEANQVPENYGELYSEDMAKAFMLGYGFQHIEKNN